MKRFLSLLGVCSVSGVLLSACVQPAPYANQSDGMNGYQVSADPSEEDLIPPLPTFPSLGECEMAYGGGACGTGAQVYAQANLPAPQGAAYWYAPFSFASMTGALTNGYFAPPAVYAPQVAYRRFIAPDTMGHYRRITPHHMSLYRNAPPDVRQRAMNAGPVRYSGNRHTIVEQPASANRPAPNAQPMQTQPANAGHVPAIVTGPAPGLAKSQQTISATPTPAPNAVHNGSMGSNPQNALPMQSGTKNPTPSAPTLTAPPAQSAPKSSVSPSNPTPAKPAAAAPHPNSKDGNKACEPGKVCK